MNVLKWVALGGIVLLALGAIVISLKQARHDRVWADDVVRLSDVSLEDRQFSIAQYRDWSYDADGVTQQSWRASGPYEISDARRAWLVIEPHPGFAGLMAHTMMVFEFQNGELLGLSVEARKEKGEAYGLLSGATNGFELTYLWATPRDMFGRRVRMQDHEIYMYELALSQDEVEAFLGALINKTMAIQSKARFYNTFTSNCTNELAKTAGLSWRPAFVFTGLSGKALHSLDRLKSDANVEAVKAQANVTEFVRGARAMDEAAFNAALVHALDDREP